MEHTLQAGDGISHDRIVSAMGAGGMGEVYLAQDLTLERAVALKILPPSLVRNEGRLRRFVIGAKSASSLNHPAIVSPDGKLVRYNEFTSVDGRMHPQLVVIPSGGGEPVAKLVLPGTMGDMTWWPDSGAITYTDRNKGWNVTRQPLSGGEPTQVTRFTEGILGDIIWSRDGARLAVVSQFGSKVGLWSLPSGTGEPKRLVEFTNGVIHNVTSSLDSKRFLFDYTTSSKDVVLISDFQ